MAKTDNLKDFLEDIADTIREHSGSEDLINPQDFSSMINDLINSKTSLSYFNISECDYYELLLRASSIVKYLDNDLSVIVPSACYVGETPDNKAVAVAINLSQPLYCYYGNTHIGTVKDFLYVVSTGIVNDEFLNNIKITEEEFNTEMA